MKRRITFIIGLYILTFYSMSLAQSRDPKRVIEKASALALQGDFGFTGSNARLTMPGHASSPSGPGNGMLYYNTATHKSYIYLNGSWVEFGEVTTYPISLANGGTGVALADGTVNQIIMSVGDGTSKWSTAVFPPTTTINQLLYSSGANTLAGLTTANNGVLVTGAGGVPSIGSTLPNAVQDNITRLGTILQLIINSVGTDAVTISMTSITGIDNQAIDVIGGEALGANEHWTGIRVKPSDLDPSGVDTRIRGLAINLSEVDLSNLPENMAGVRIVMPSGLAGQARDNTEAIYIKNGDIEHNFDVPATAGAHFTSYDMVVDASLLHANSQVHAYDVQVAGGVPSGIVAAIGTHSYVAPIHQHIGTYVTPSQSTYAGRKTSGGGSWVDGIDGIEIFVVNSDEVYIGSNATFEEIEVIMGTPGTKTVSPTFWYNIAADTWTQFYPGDATGGYVQSGLISWDTADIPTWTNDGDPGGAETDAGYWIKAIRTAGPDPGTPIPTTMKVGTITFYDWDKDGKLSVSNVAGATYGDDESVTNAELLRINTVSSNVQDQLNGKEGTLSKSNLTATSPVNVSNSPQIIGVSAAAITIDDADANGSTKGVATFTANDFDASSGLVSIDYVNGQKATSGQDGFLNSTDWSTFNGKQTGDADLSTLAASTAWRIFYSNGSSVITELVLGANGTFLESNGASAAPAFRTLLAADIPDISGTYSPLAGSGSLVTVGTVTSGVWNAGAITSSGPITDNSNTATKVAAGTTGERPGGTNGYLRANTTLTRLEYYIGEWLSIASISDVAVKLPIQLNAGLTVNETYSGQTASITVGETVVFGQVLVKKSDGEYYKTDADAVTTMPGMVIALEGKDDGEACIVLIQGWVVDTDWNWTVGDGQNNILFVDDGTAGAVVQYANKPADSGDQLQVIGHVETADCIYFNPSYVLVEVN